MFRIIIALLTSLTLSACAFGDAELALAYNADAANAGLLSEAPPATLHLADVEDRRTDKMRVGYKRNGYGMKTADILSARPEPEVVKEALASVLEANGHTLAGADSRYALQSTLTNFWFDYKTGFVSVEFYGSIQAELSLIDTTSGDVLYSELFDGYYSEKTGGGLKGTWERVMNETLADFANKVNLSPGLMNALAQITEEPAAPRASAMDEAAAGS